MVSSLVILYEVGIAGLVVLVRHDGEEDAGVSEMVEVSRSGQ